MNRSLVVALLLLVGTSAALQGQERDRSRNDSDPGPISTLLRIQDQLSLTSAQVTELQSIDQELDQLNQPVVARLVEVRRRIRTLGPRDEMSAEERALFDSYVAEARPLMRDIQKNNRAAMGRVGDVLTDAQKDTIARLLKERENRERSRRNSRSDDRRN